MLETFETHRNAALFGSLRNILPKTLLALCWFGLSASSALATTNDEAVSFDAPALAAVHELIIDGALITNEKTIEVLIPISTEIRPADRKNIQEFRFDISWNRDVFPIVDYGPKTQTTSKIDGLVSVEKSEDRNASLGFNLSGQVDPISGNAKLDASSRNSERLSYQQIPDHEVLVASGTVARGTGAFFRFHPSKTETLEGGRDLIVAFRVPRDWRTGLLQIQCRAVGERRIVGSWKEPLEIGRSFVVPIYLEGDDQGRRSATEFVRSEQRLRKSWRQHRLELAAKSSGIVGMGLWQRASSASPFSSSHNQATPNQWAHLLIQSGEDAYLDKYQQQLPQNVAVAAGQFVQARESLLQQRLTDFR